MKRSLKNRLSIIGILTILVIAAVFHFRNQNKDAEVVKSLEENVIPFIQTSNVTFFFDADWCKAVKYDFRAAVQVADAAKSNSCLSSAVPFSENDMSVFNKIKDKLSSIKLERFPEISIEYPLNQPEHAGLPHESIGLAFHTDCYFCRTRYVYWPNYNKLPPNIDSEIKYIPIDKNWYRIEQDWN